MAFLWWIMSLPFCKAEHLTPPFPQQACPVDLWGSGIPSFPRNTVQVSMYFEFDAKFIRPIPTVLNTFCWMHWWRPSAYLWLLYVGTGFVSGFTAVNLYNQRDLHRGNLVILQMHALKLLFIEHKTHTCYRICLKQLLVIFCVKKWRPLSRYISSHHSADVPQSVHPQCDSANQHQTKSSRWWMLFLQ